MSVGADVPITNMHPLSALREMAFRAKRLSDQLEVAVATARAERFSWEDIAAQLYANAPSGRRPLGELFPGGTSATTIRRMYEGRS